MLNTKSIDELLSENKLLHDILDNVNDAIYAVDSNGKNHRIQQSNGKSGEIRPQVYLGL